MRLAPLCLLAALTLSACGANPDYYLLPPPETAVQRPSPAKTIVVAEVGLPAYAEAEEIAALSGEGVVAVNQDALWADAPRRALTRHLVAALQTRLDAEIASEPWPELDRPALRVVVVADRLIGRPGGAVQFTGQYLLVAPDSGQIAASDRFAIAVPIPGEGYPALLEAYARAMEHLAEEIAARIARLSPGEIVSDDGSV